MATTRRRPRWIPVVEALVNILLSFGLVLGAVWWSGRW